MYYFPLRSLIESIINHLITNVLVYIDETLTEVIKLLLYIYGLFKHNLGTYQKNNC